MMVRKRTDAVQAELVKKLRSAGCYVDVTSELGDGFPDLVVATPSGKVYLIEVKARYGHMTESEVKYAIKHVLPGFRIFTDADAAINELMRNDKD